MAVAQAVVQEEILQDLASIATVVLVALIKDPAAILVVQVVAVDQETVAVPVVVEYRDKEILVVEVDVFRVKDVGVAVVAVQDLPEAMLIHIPIHNLMVAKELNGTMEIGMLVVAKALAKQLIQVIKQPALAATEQEVRMDLVE